MAIDRYKNFRINGTIKQIPFIKIPFKLTDKEETYVNGTTRMDLLSNKYYKDCKYWWLILAANPEISSLEFKIPENTIIRIPYPLETTLQEYTDAVNKYILYYGI